MRKYESSHWVSTSLQGIDYDEASYTMFMRLFNYIGGDNVKSAWNNNLILVSKIKLEITGNNLDALNV